MNLLQIIHLNYLRCSGQQILDEVVGFLNVIWGNKGTFESIDSSFLQ